MKDNESVYDAEIFPLMAQIIEICKTSGIAVHATFQYSKTGLCSTHIPIPGESHMLLDVMNALSRCAEGNSVNIDKFLFHMKKNYPNGSSIFMSVLGSEPIGHTKKAVDEWHNNQESAESGKTTQL